jgi:hypothetical protein
MRHSALLLLPAMSASQPAIQGPILSAILPAWDTFDSIRATLAHLRRQSIAGHMEVVMVCPDASKFELREEEMDNFAAWRLVEIGSIDTRSYAFAEGVMAARGEFVVLCEDHCFPEPEWAEALIKRHQSAEYAAVGPMFANANPENAVSDADLLIAYGPFLQGLPGGERPFVAGHNSCYRREVLLGEGDKLPDTLEAEYVFHTGLSAAGAKFYVEPDARVSHMNFGTWASAIYASYLSGKGFGASRACAWPVSRRILFVFAWIVIPAIRLKRILPLARQAGWARGRNNACVPALLACLMASAAGEWIGNLLGRHCRAPSLVHYEFHRTRFSPKLKNRDLATEQWVAGEV